jgi:hypothetical protein
MFSDLMSRIGSEAVTTFFRAHFGVEPPRPIEAEQKTQAQLAYSHGDGGGAPEAGKPRQVHKLPNWGRKKGGGRKRQRQAQSGS